MAVRAWTEKSAGYGVAELPSMLLPMLERLHYQQGEKRLMLAVLTDAVGCIERYRSDRGVRSWPVFCAASRWVLSHDRLWPFSFENICLALDLDLARLRAALCAPFPLLLAATHGGRGGSSPTHH